MESTFFCGIQPSVVCICCLNNSENLSTSSAFYPERFDSEFLQDQVQPDLEVCPSPRANITLYQIRFQANSSVKAVNVNISSCTAERCSHTFKPPPNPPSSYDSVSVAAENVVGVGAARTCTTQTISELNILKRSLQLFLLNGPHATCTIHFL